MNAIAAPKKPSAPRGWEISEEAMDLIADLILDFFAPESNADQRGEEVAE